MVSRPECAGFRNVRTWTVLRFIGGHEHTSPSYLSRHITWHQIDTLLKMFADACIVQIHRDPRLGRVMSRRRMRLRNGRIINTRLHKKGIARSAWQDPELFASSLSVLPASSTDRNNALVDNPAVENSLPLPKDVPTTRVVLPKRSGEVT